MVSTYTALFHLTRHSEHFIVRNHSPTHTLIHTPLYTDTGGKLVEVNCPRTQGQHAHVGAGFQTADFPVMRRPALITD